MTRCLLLCVLAASQVCCAGQDQEASGPDEAPGKLKPLPQIAAWTADMEHVPGFLSFYRDAERGTIWLEIETWDEDLLYASGLGSGLGSNPVGLDRGQWGPSRVVQFKRVGRRVFLIGQNVRYRASGTNAAERRAVSDSFAPSVLWAGDVAARTGERCLVDVKSLLVRDAHRVVATLKSTGQGSYSLDSDRSFVAPESCRGFPENTELDATLTFSSGEPGRLVRETAADGAAFSLRLHHSFVKLPGPGYTPRVAHPRVASLRVTFADYSTPLDQPLTKRWIVRHRLQKADPKQARSPAVEPIIYYLDPGTPQPVRDALLEGARWWNAAFESAGFIDAFQVKMLPVDADPMDVRYNVIQWVHRSTRGWSYGQTVVDPRTGEIIKGHVLLGSLRVRQDRLLIEGLTAAVSSPAAQDLSGCGIAGMGADSALALFDPQHSPIDVSLARLRQLSAHEVGHTIGFAHNFAASTYGDRASVMDYPAPRVALGDDGQLDLSDAYGVGVGVWDHFMVKYAYQQFPDARSEAAGLKTLIDEARANGLRYLTDADARPAGAAHPLASLWDNGSDPIAELDHVMRVRRRALDRLSDARLPAARSQSHLELVLVPVYLHHRYQLAAAAKTIAGFDYRHTSGDEEPQVEPVPVARQQEATDALLRTLDSAQLRIPPALLSRLPPRPWTDPSDRERFPGRTAMVFDPDEAVQVAATLTLAELLQPERVSRLAAYAGDDWNVRLYLGRIVAAVWPAGPAASARPAAIRRIVQRVLTEQLIELAANDTTSGGARATTVGVLRKLQRDLERRTGLASRADDQDHLRDVMAQIERFLQRPHEPAAPGKPLDPPPGSPIGGR